VLYCYILRRERMLWPHTEEEMEGEKRVKLHLPGINPFIRAFLNASNTWILEDTFIPLLVGIAQSKVSAVLTSLLDQHKHQTCKWRRLWKC
jgi:hypothetical protein